MPPAARVLPALLVVLLAAATHMVALRNTEFTYDDVPLVQNNARLDVHSKADLWRLVTDRYWGDNVGGERLWRPAPLLTFAAERWLHRSDPDLSRALNVALHTGCAWLLFVLLASWIPRRPALLASVVFLVHPVHAEVTAGVVGRAEILALGGVLLAFWLHRHLRLARRAWVRGGLGVLAACSFTVAFLSKEIALAGPVLLALVELARCSRSRRRRLAAAGWVLCGAGPAGAVNRLIGRLRGKGRGSSRARARFRLGLRLVWPYLLFGLTIGGYLLARHAVLEDLVARASGRTLGNTGFAARFLVATLIYLDSWLSLAVPHGTSAHYPFGGVYLEPWAAALDPVQGRQAHELAWGSALSFVPFALHAALLGLGAWLLVQRRSWGRVIGLGIWGFYLALGPVSNVLIPIGVLRADRLLYTPSVWACVALVAGPATALCHVSRRVALRVGYCLLAACLAWSCTSTLQGNLRAWSNNHWLWYCSYLRYEDQPRIQIALGNEYLRDRNAYLSREERLSTAEGLFVKAVAATPPGTSLAGKSRAALAGILLQRGAAAEAIQLYHQATQLEPRLVSAHQGLARAFLSQANAAPTDQLRLSWLLRAERTARQATRFGVKDYSLWLTYGTILSALDGREHDALLAYDHAIGLRANPWEARFNRARLRAFSGNPSGAVDDFRYVAEFSLAGGELPDDRLLDEVLNELARLSKETGDTETQAWIRTVSPALPAATPR